MADNTCVRDYLESATLDRRLKILSRYREESRWIPLYIARDLLQLDLDEQEQIALLQCLDNSDKLAYEDLITKGIYRWSQNVASIAVREWALRSDCVLAHRLVPICLNPHIPQRLSYTMLDLVWFGWGDLQVAAFTNMADLEGMSSAFLSLLFKRALQWNIESERLRNLAEKSLACFEQFSSKEDQSTPYALLYLMKFSPDTLKEKIEKSNSNTIWVDITKNLLSSAKLNSDIKKLEKLFVSTKKKDVLEKFHLLWPTLWNRASLSRDIVRDALYFYIDRFVKSEILSIENSWHIFAGISSDVLCSALVGLKDDDIFILALRVVGNLVHSNYYSTIVDEVSKRFVNSKEEISSRLENIPFRFRARHTDKLDNYSAKEAYTELKSIIAGEVKLSSEPICMSFNPIDINIENSSLCLSKESVERYKFIELAYNNRAVGDLGGSSFWSLLAKAWQSPDSDVLEQLSQEARKNGGLFNICYIDTLGRFKGVDKAALKILDFIRYEDDRILLGVVRALAGIGTGRANQEIVHFLTRPNASLNVQLEITNLLAQADLTHLQSELRSAITDLNVDPKTEEAQREVRESLTSLLHSGTNVTSDNSVAEDISQMDDSPSTEQLDLEIEKKTKQYVNLSSESKRALRTAQFFHSLVEKSGTLNTIDLSPAIDMLYKSLELTFRETFEHPTNILINHGILQRKLDLIGYARPIPASMEKFEKYIEKLPIIQTIPFFSRFKLRKMLRAICQYRRGKRFTLDGLKAFALFFVCFSRKSCQYGLNNLFPIPGYSDDELFEFCKSLHVFQDFRNRAAHEGFHPSASNDLNKLWSDCAMILDHLFKVKEALTLDDSMNVKKVIDELPKEPIIIHKNVS